jgi:DtxR family Mn-dependent transcriptional regulator
MNVGEAGICGGVKDSSATFLKFLDRHQIALGNNIKIMEREEYDGSLTLLIEGREISISHQIASNLYLNS